MAPVGHSGIRRLEGILTDPGGVEIATEEVDKHVFLVAITLFEIEIDVHLIAGRGRLRATTEGLW